MPNQELLKIARQFRELEKVNDWEARAVDGGFLLRIAIEQEAFNGAAWALFHAMIADHSPGGTYPYPTSMFFGTVEFLQERGHILPTPPPTPFESDLAASSIFSAMADWIELLANKPSSELLAGEGKTTTSEKRPRRVIWTDWKHQEELTNARIRDKWNAMSQDERNAICFDDPKPLPDKSGQKKNSANVVKQAILREEKQRKK